MATRTEANRGYDTGFFGHPRGLATLFFTEMWERFSYYGMRAILILYMVAPVSAGGLGFSVPKGGAVYGFYTALVYLMNLPGGWLADRIIGQQRAVLYGAILISAGEFCLVAPGLPMFYVGLALLMLGTGLLKPNVSTIVGQLYGAGDARRDSGFSIFYMGINVGALISPLICGYIGERISWRLGFGAAGVGMLAGLIQYALSGKYLGTAGREPGARATPAQKRNGLLAGLGSAAALALIAALGRAGMINLTAELISDALGWVLLAISAAVFAWLIFGRGWSAIERKRAVATLVIFAASAIFWAAYEQAGSSLNLFAERNTDRHVFGWEFPASWFQFVQPVFVIALAPVFAWLWIALRHREPSVPAKFSWGLLLGGLAFAILVPAAAFSLAGKLVSPWWLTGTYFLQTLGELCLSPVGLSAMTKLAPQRVAGFMMGVWFLSVSIGDWTAGKAASLYESMPLTELFGVVATVSVAAAVVLALVTRPTVRLMSGVK
ncbi:MAG TPA: peptide MFS transporter [Bryobacteraceae bacterium]|nr:peptide MFS transporter [Bryobacteraceae bacterium]